MVISDAHTGTFCRPDIVSFNEDSSCDVEMKEILRLGEDGTSESCDDLGTQDLVADDGGRASLCRGVRRIRVEVGAILTLKQIFGVLSVLYAVFLL